MIHKMGILTSCPQRRLMESVLKNLFSFLEEMRFEFTLIMIRNQMNDGIKKRKQCMPRSLGRDILGVFGH